MNCPNDSTALQMTVREGIEIDYCPNCRGVWLDRGELDKLIERSGFGASRQPEQHQQQPQQRRDYDDDDHFEERRHDSHGNHHKKKEGFLGELFDF